MQNFQSFTQEEAEAILRRAAGNDLPTDHLTEDQLVSMAAELGISSEAVRAAALRHREEAQFASRIQGYRAYIKKKIIDDVGAWAGTSLLLVVIDLLITRGETHGFPLTWSLWPVGIWGAGIVVETTNRLMMLRNPEPEKVRVWWERQQKKALKKRNSEPQPEEEE